jgi:hypothetical protein
MGASAPRTPERDATDRSPRPGPDDLVLAMTIRVPVSKVPIVAPHPDERNPTDER